MNPFDKKYGLNERKPEPKSSSSTIDSIMAIDAAKVVRQQVDNFEPTPKGVCQPAVRKHKRICIEEEKVIDDDSDSDQDSDESSLNLAQYDDWAVKTENIQKQKISEESSCRKTTKASLGSKYTVAHSNVSSRAKREAGKIVDSIPKGGKKHNRMLALSPSSKRNHLDGETRKLWQVFASENSDSCCAKKCMFEHCYKHAEEEN